MHISVFNDHKPATNRCAKSIVLGYLNQFLINSTSSAAGLLQYYLEMVISNEVM